MANKKVTVLLYGADRELWSGPRCSLSIRKVEFGGASVIHQQKVDEGTSALELNLVDVEFDQLQTYLILVKSKRHRTG